MAVGDGIDGVGAAQMHLDVKTPLSEWVSHIKEFKPNMIIGYPSAVKILGELAEKGEVALKINRIVTCGEPLGKTFPEIKQIVIDAGFKTPWIAKQVINDNRFPVLPYKRPMGKTGFFRPHEFIYDEYFDCVLCPENSVLKYFTTTREGYRQFKSDPNTCQNCPSRFKCTENKNCVKTVEKHVWTDYLEIVEDYRHTPPLRELYEHRKETIERVFADAKEKCAMRFTYLKGLTRNLGWVRLKFAAMNLKKYAIHQWHIRTYFIFCRFPRPFAFVA